MAQLATSANGQPWVCSVYYVVDDELNLYWLSFPNRRHSQEIGKNNKVAITIAVKTDLPVVGLQAEGAAELVKDSKQIEKITKLYVDRYNAGQNFYNNFLEGKNKHMMYKFTPKKFTLFDEVNFPEDGYQEFLMS